MKVYHGITSISLAVLAIAAILSTQARQVNITVQDQTSKPQQFDGIATNGLRPVVDTQRQGNDWNIELNFMQLEPVKDNEWLKINNHFGSQLQLWSTDGKEAHSQNADLLKTFKQPQQTSVSNVMAGEIPRFKSRLWLPIGPRWNRPTVSNLVPSAHFSLAEAFGPTTNNVVIGMVPLLYHVNSNLVDAQLVEFPPIKLKLLTNGTVEKVESP